MHNNEPPPIPFHESLLEGISIEVELFCTNLAYVGRGDHALEDWFWLITIANTANPFCTAKGFWGIYAVRSTQAVDLQFNTKDNSSVLQFWPNDEPTKFIVGEGSDGKNFGICLMTYIFRPDVGTIQHTRGLYMYNSA